MNDLIWGLDARSEGLRTLVLLNGYPVYMPPTIEQQIYATKLNPWIIEGDNELRIRLGRPEDGAELDEDAELVVDAWRTPPGVLQTDESYVLRFEWDRAQHELEQDGMTDLLSHPFHVPRSDAFGRWAWQDATPFHEDQRVAIETVVGSCRQALEQRDVDRLLALLSLKFAELSHALGTPPGRLEQLLRETLTPYFDADGWTVDPIDYGVVSFIPACQGKTVLVMGRMGAPILRGHIVVDEGEEPPLNPFMMELAVSNLGGTWTVVR